ncbi:hypothetical protein LINPERPRIM_LOCUS16719 [Linum perenne]
MRRLFLNLMILTSSCGGK